LIIKINYIVDPKRIIINTLFSKKEKRKRIKRTFIVSKWRKREGKEGGWKVKTGILLGHV
jgi:hypothetical protein